MVTVIIHTENNSLYICLIMLATLKDRKQSCSTPKPSLPCGLALL